MASYAPHVLIAGGLVLGYLPGYLCEEGGRNRAGLLRLVVPDNLLTAAMLVAMGVVTIWALRTTRLEAPQHAALVLFGSLLLVTTPSYPWYAVPLVVLAVLARRLDWLAVPAAGYLAYAFTLVPPVRAIGSRHPLTRATGRRLILERWFASLAGWSRASGSSCPTMLM